MMPTEQGNLAASRQRVLAFGRAGNNGRYVITKLTGRWEPRRGVACEVSGGTLLDRVNWAVK
jgi:hypothetical protein